MILIRSVILLFALLLIKNSVAQNSLLFVAGLNYEQQTEEEVHYVSPRVSIGFNPNQSDFRIFINSEYKSHETEYSPVCSNCLEEYKSEFNYIEFGSSLDYKYKQFNKIYLIFGLAYSKLYSFKTEQTWKFHDEESTVTLNEFHCEADYLGFYNEICIKTFEKVKLYPSINLFYRKCIFSDDNLKGDIWGGGVSVVYKIFM